MQAAHPGRSWRDLPARLAGGLLAACLLFTGAEPARAAEPAGVILSPSNAVWRFLDTGVNPNEAWAHPGFDDHSWASGPGPFGYDPELIPATPIQFGPDPQQKHITTWFRRTFVVSQAANYQRLLLRVLRDDGMAVYLNGQEVWRDNLPPGPLAAETRALTGVEEGLFYHAMDVGSRLVDGTNVLAVEVHQFDPASSDLLFDLELSATIVRGPYLLRATTNSIEVRWRTVLPTETILRHGPTPGQWGPPWVDNVPSTNHAVLLTNLQPDTRYFYQIQARGQILAGGPSLAFRTAPMGPRPVRIWVVGDSGTATWGHPFSAMAKAVAQAYADFAAATRPADVWLMLGDNAYYQGFDHEYQKGMFDVYQAVLPSTPVWSTIGNHEAYSFIPNGPFPFYDIFNPPAEGDSGAVASGTRRYYSFDYANIHFVNLDSMLSDRTTNGPMWQWLQQDLAANTNDWLIAFWHHPPYSKGNHDSDNLDGQDPELVAMRENFLPLLEAYGVDLVLAGHSHTYERSYLLSGHYGYSRTLVPQMILDAGSGRTSDTGAYRKVRRGPSPNQGTVYVVAGCAGSTTGGTLNHPAMAVSLNELGSLVLDVDQQRLDARFLRETGVVDDQFTLLKGVPFEPLRMVGTRMEGNLLTLRWKSRVGRIYRVERAASVADPVWVPISLPITASGLTTSWTLPVLPDQGPTLFRVVFLGEL